MQATKCTVTLLYGADIQHICLPLNKSEEDVVTSDMGQKPKSLYYATSTGSELPDQRRFNCESTSYSMTGRKED